MSDFVKKCCKSLRLLRRNLSRYWKSTASKSLASRGFPADVFPDITNNFLTKYVHSRRIPAPLMGLSQGSNLFLAPPRQSMKKFLAVRSSVWFPLGSMAALVLVGAAAVSFVPAGQPVQDRARADAIVAPKGDLDEMKPGRSDEARIGANEQRNPDANPEVLAYLTRAYPEKNIPTEASLNAQKGWAALNADPHSGGTWQTLGPSQSVFPGVLNVLADGALYVTAGRVTAMAIAPFCSEDRCPIYVAAAGGGVWRTSNGLSGHPNWQFVSGSFGTNAMGSLLIDPRDSSGKTIFAGTGEPNASADSEAGVGIYKSTDGGSSWSLVPGSDMFFQRSIGQMALD